MLLNEELLVCGIIWRKLISRVMLVMVLFAGLMLGKEASAVDYGHCGASGGSNFYYKAVIPATLRLPVNKPVGSMLVDTGWVRNPVTAVSIGCYGYNEIKYTYMPGFATSLVSGYSDVYRTGVPGIGVRVYASNDTAGGNPVPLAAWPGTWVPLNAGAFSSYGPMPSFRFQLLVTGPISTGTTAFPLGGMATNTYLGTLSYGNLETGDISPGFIYVSNNLTVTAASCSVNTPANFIVNMPAVSTQELPSVGASSGQGSFKLNLTCMWGIKVNMTLTDATDPANAGNILSLSGDSTARGVAYQIRHAGTPVVYGPDSSAAGNPGQFWVATSPGSSPSTFDIPFTVNYIRTGDILPGTANAAATYTMSYQ